MFLVVGGIHFQSCEKAEEFLETTTGLTDEEIIEGLKSALAVGTDTASTNLSALNGYYGDELVKILLPEEAGVIVDNISRLPGGIGQSLIDEAVLAINRAAEDAASKAAPIFVSAIEGITISDGLSILNGADDAATAYLKTNTYSDLDSAFTPEISSALNKDIIGGVSAESAYSTLINAYNTASLNGTIFNEVTTNSLTEHTTQRALDGLFIKVADQEAKIRSDINHRVNDILKKVFGS